MPEFTGPNVSGTPIPRSFTIAAKDLAAPFDLTINAVSSALQDLPEAKVLRTDSDIGVVVVQLPDHGIEQVRAALGDGFMIDPNPQLEMLNKQPA